MPRRSLHLTDPQRRRVGDVLLEQRAYHLAQAEKRRSDAHGLAKRYREQMKQLRKEMRDHARLAADNQDVLEAVA